VSRTRRPSPGRAASTASTTQVSCESVTRVHQRVGLLMPPVSLARPPRASRPTRRHVHPGAPHRRAGAGVPVPLPQHQLPPLRGAARAQLPQRPRGVTGDSEKWEIVALDGHPFHIHINPFLVCPNDSNKEPNFPHWRDTCGCRPRTARAPADELSRVQRALRHPLPQAQPRGRRDDGALRALRPDDRACQCQRTDAMGQCVSQAGCQEDDRQCAFAAEVTASYPRPPLPNPARCGP
jgi:L-ascorbate oxidase